MLPFIDNADILLGIEDRLRAAWTDFDAREWMGATVFAGAALELFLLWALKRDLHAAESKRPLDELHLADLIDLATKYRVIDEASARASVSREGCAQPYSSRQSITLGEACSKATALTALAAVYRVIDDLKKRR